MIKPTRCFPRLWNSTHLHRKMGDRRTPGETGKNRSGARRAEVVPFRSKFGNYFACVGEDMYLQRPENINRLARYMGRGVRLASEPVRPI
jgi:hypothetical protein